MKTGQTVRAAVAGLMVVGLVAAVPAAGVHAAGAKAVPAMANRSSIIVQSDFSKGAGPWPLNQHTNISGGMYNVSASPNHYAQYHPAKPGRLGDGAIAAVMRLGGVGLAGVMGRFHATASNAWSMYVCWISTASTFGCFKDVNDNFTTIIKTQHSASIKANGVNTVILSMVGPDVLFRINGKDVAHYTDKGAVLPAGNWGIFVDSPTNTPVKAHYGAIAIVKA